MIVYGDPAYEADLGEFVARLRARAEGVRTGLRDAPGDELLAVLARLDGLRGLLVQAGQCEQAMADAAERIGDPAGLQAIETATFHAGSAFAAAWLSIGDSWANWPSALARVCDCVERMSCSLERLRELPHIRVTIKIPEGFAFYALYPEQYIQTTLNWIAEHRSAPSRTAIVIGIRSIGTTLSAVVAAVLAANGWAVRRMSVRPSGHPFERKVEIPHEITHATDQALVIDEGPGLSGSSMAAVAAALVRGGFDSSRIAFFPGHDHPPGQASSPEVRRWWAEVRRYVTPLDSLRWAGRSLTQVIRAASPKLIGSDDQADRIEDLSAGGWRAAVYESPADWPAVCAAFERTKYRCVFSSGSALLWKFSGFTDESGGGDRRALGFTLSPWISGAPLARSDMTSSVLAHIGRHVAGVAGPLMQPPECRRAWERLAHMMYWNSRESMGENAAERLRAWADDPAARDEIGAMPACGDGHLAPHEWRRRDDGQLIKTSRVGHRFDHTMVGLQPVTWDLAGVIVEWDLDETAAGLFVESACRAGLDPMPMSILNRYEAAYAAFRLGQCTMCGEVAGWESEEGLRLRSAADGYRRRIEDIMASRLAPCC